jgi:D-alanyl-D-alanine carboxypeptidase
VKSANDIAIVVAEGVGGSVEDFVAMMNREAAVLGMGETHFVNPNGLHAEGRQTSARDMALLARQIMLEFPHHRGLFNIGAIQLGKRVMENTNGIIGRYPGATGMKTGYLCASGFNVVSTASRNGRTLVAVVLGAPSSTERTLKTIQLLDYGFSHPVSGPPLASLPPDPDSLAPDMSEKICGKGLNEGIAEGEAALSAEKSALSASAQKLQPREDFDPVPVFIGAKTQIRQKSPTKSMIVTDKAMKARSRMADALPQSQAALNGPPVRPAGLERSR